MDNGLGDVVDDERLLGMLINKFHSLREMSLKDEDIVYEPVIIKFCDTTVELGAKDLTVFRLILHHMADGLELTVLDEALEMATHVFIRQRNPTHHSSDKIALIG